MILILQHVSRGYLAPTFTAPTPPSRPVPVPKGMMGRWCWWQTLARALTSSTDRGNTTTSGGRQLWGTNESLTDEHEVASGTKAEKTNYPKYDRVPKHNFQQYYVQCKVYFVLCQKKTWCRLTEGASDLWTDSSLPCCSLTASANETASSPQMTLNSESTRSMAALYAQTKKTLKMGWVITTT